MFDNKIRAISIAALTFTLAACGGGGSSGGSSAAAQATPASTPSANTEWTFKGSAPTVTGLNGQVAVVLTPDTLTSSTLSGSAITDASAPLSSQVQQASYGGAFTTISTGTSAISLNKGGTIADINGTGGYIAIGRWTNGSDTSGGTYNANQGATYAVGTPLTLTAAAGAGTLSCTSLMATSPSAANGSVAPGSFGSATAILDLSTLNLNNFTATVTIGSDTNASFSKASATSGGMSGGSGVTLLTRVMGTNAAKPLVAVAYGAKLTNTGDINGLVVLQCQ